MLQTLEIENVALIDKVVLNFDEKLNVISGETGAGKSIMLDSLSFVFGGRADKSLIRNGKSSMKVDAIFSNLTKENVDFVKEELGIDCNQELFVSRELDVNGKNTCKINGELVPVASVKKVCQTLVDIHGQSEHLAILNNDYQLEIVDMFGDNIKEKLTELDALIEKYKSVENAINALGGSEKDKQNLIDLYSYQIEEISKAQIKENELEELTNEKKEMQQFEKIKQSLEETYSNSCKNSFGESASEKVAESLKNIESISDLNEHYKILADRFKSVLIEIEDLNDTIKNDVDNLSFDQERFNYVDDRIDFIKSMFRKYGGDFENLKKYYDEIQNKLDNLINGEQRYNELQQEKLVILDNINLLQDDISSKRKKSAEKLKTKMQEELIKLAMPNAKFDVEFDTINELFSSFGRDRVEFMFSSNLGFDVKPLNKVVSGGEMSRVMLAYKIVVAQVDSIHTVVFDEIDSGLSGNVATIVGEYMARLSLNKQIIAVSHLPQICAMADLNIKVEKYSDAITTHTKALTLKDENLYVEIARLMGAIISDSGISIGRELKNKCDEYKNKLNNFSKN